MEERQKWRWKRRRCSTRDTVLAGATRVTHAPVRGHRMVEVQTTDEGGGHQEHSGGAHD